MAGTPDSSQSLSGGCQCGAVRYRLLCTPAHASVCYCRMCQKASGQPMMAFARVPKDKLAWTRGTPASFHSSNLVERSFCAACGTPLTYNFIEGSNVSVTIGSLDDPEAVRPNAQYSVDMQVSWLAGIHQLPGKLTKDSLSPPLAGRVVSHQHPDQDT